MIGIVQLMRTSFLHRAPIIPVRIGDIVGFPEH